MRAMSFVMLITLRSRTSQWAILEQEPVTKEKCCPYCIVAGFSFQKMTNNLRGEYMCPTCGHVEPLRVECSCDRCLRSRAREDTLPPLPDKQDCAGIWAFLSSSAGE